MYNPIPRGKYNRTKGIVLTLLDYFRENKQSSGLSIVEISKYVTTHGMQHESVKSSISRIHRYDLINRKAKNQKTGPSIYIYSISARGKRWLDNYVDQAMRDTFLQPMLGKLPIKNSKSMRVVFGTGQNANTYGLK